MEAKNFRIGNLVQDFYKQEPYVIDADGIKLCFLIEKEGRYQTTMHSGIPLTEEWMLKFGFELFPWGWVKKSLKNFGVRINVKSFSYDVAGNRPVEIKYVHQLQNIYFALTGEELQLAK